MAMAGENGVSGNYTLQMQASQMSNGELHARLDTLQALFVHVKTQLKSPAKWTINHGKKNGWYSGS